MPLFTFVSIVGIGLDYRCLAEKQGFFRLAVDDQLLGLVGGFAGANYLWFWIWARERIARACLGYIPLYCCDPLFLSQIIILTIIIL